MEIKYAVITVTSMMLAYAAIYFFKMIEHRVNGNNNTKGQMGLLAITLPVILLPNIYFVMNGAGIKSLLLLNIILFAAVLSSYEDLKYKLIEDEIHLMALISGILVYLFTGLDLKARLVGFALGGGLLLLLAVFSKGGMGGADIKLMAVYGMILGPKCTIIALLLAFTAGAASGLVMLALKLAGRKDMIPFSPFLSLGAVSAFILGDKLVEIYFKMLLN